MPHYPEAHVNLGVALAYQGKADAAISAFREALRICPNLDDARRNLDALSR